MSANPTYQSYKQDYSNRKNEENWGQTPRSPIKSRVSWGLAPKGPTWGTSPNPSFMGAGSPTIFCRACRDKRPSHDKAKSRRAHKTFLCDIPHSGWKEFSLRTSPPQNWGSDPAKPNKIGDVVSIRATTLNSKMPTLSLCNIDWGEG